MDSRLWLTEYFLHPALLERARSEQFAVRRSPDNVAEWLQFFGAARLLDHGVDDGLIGDEPATLDRVSAHGVDPWAGVAVP